MTLGELIDALSVIDPKFIVKEGFDNPHSYRGYYEQLSFSLCCSTTVGEMLACANMALDATYTGYHGGDFTMHKDTDVWLSNVGEASGESIGPVLLRYMTKGAQRIPRPLNKPRLIAEIASHYKRYGYEEQYYLKKLLEKELDTKFLIPEKILLEKL